MRTLLKGADVKWQCMQCGHVWRGKAPELRRRRVRCKQCGSWYVYPGWGDKTWSELRKDIFKRDGFQCRRCGAKGVRLYVHHIVSLSSGGTSNPENLETVCEKCHTKAHLLPILVGAIIIGALIFIIWLLNFLGR